MEEFQKQLDECVTLSKDDCVISLDFSRISYRSSGHDNEMSLFTSLAATPFKEVIEHPLCQAYLYEKFKHVRIIFVFALLIPHFIFSGDKFLKPYLND